MNDRWCGHAWILRLVFFLLWADLARILSVFWSGDPQYAYGWTVPFLSLFLFWLCWVSRPEPCRPRGRTLTFAIGGILALSLLPSRLLLEAMPDWRLAHWSQALAVVGISLCACHFSGGGKWLRHFAFPVAFILVAVPLPVKIEQPLINTLSDWVSSLTADGLNLCGIPAVQRGNVIEISTGMVGVEEACSGVRSFQATLMASLFLGQLWSFPLRFRSVLVFTGVAFAFLCNVGRALLLSAIAEKRGPDAIGKWHDPAGFTVFGISFAGLLGLALLLRSRISTEKRTQVPASDPLPLPLPLYGVYVLAAWMALVAVGTELWYRSAPPATTAWWRVEWPEKKAGFTEIPPSEKVRELSYDYGRQARWRDDDGSEWIVFYFRWLPGMASARNFARWHNPEQCLTSLGFARAGEYEPVTYRDGGFELAFQALRFDAKGKAHYVFFCVWEDRNEAGAPKLPQQWNLAARMRAVMDRKRRLGQQVLEIVISGVEDEKAARGLFEKRLKELLRPDSILPAEMAATK